MNEWKVLDGACNAMNGGNVGGSSIMVETFLDIQKTRFLISQQLISRREMIMYCGRIELERLIQARGENFTSVSRLLGRNDAYIQQFIKRGTPRKLAEEDRRLLAHYFDVDEMLLGGHENAAWPAERTITVEVLTSSPYGNRTEVMGDKVPSRILFDRIWMEQLTKSPVLDLCLLHIDDDSMEPTLVRGDQLLVDRSTSMSSPRDGIFVYRTGDRYVARCLAANTRQCPPLLCDNASHPYWHDPAVASVEIVGRAIWVGRRLI